MVQRRSSRSQLYHSARDLGGVQGASKGPTSYGKRAGRPKVYRSMRSVNRRVLKEIGL
jgi:hypothetical protein